MTNESLNENQKIFITEKDRLDLFHKIEPFGEYTKEYAFSTDCLERFCSGRTELPDYAYSHIRALLKKEFKEYCKENDLHISKENLGLIIKSYNLLDSKIRYIANEILGINFIIDRWEIGTINVEIEWTEYDNYTEYESFPIYLLAINSLNELKDAWKKVKDERAELKRKKEEERKKQEKEDKEKVEKALYEQLRAKYGN